MSQIPLLVAVESPDPVADTTGEVRDHLQRHYTPQQLADVIVSRLVRRLRWAPEILIEPSCGGGAFIRAANRAWPGVHTIGVDLDRNAPGLSICDEAHADDWPTVAEGIANRSDLGCSRVLVCGNPPFGAANAAQLACTLNHVKAAIRIGDATSLILPWAPLGGVPAYASIMHGDGAPVDAWPFFPRPWGEHIREAAAYLWAEEEARPGTLVEWLPRWRS